MRCLRLPLLLAHASLARSGCLSPSLRSHLRSHLASRLACSDATALSLVEQLAALAPPSQANRFTQQQGERVARALPRDEALCGALLRGEITMRAALSRLDDHAAAAREMFDTIKSHHAELQRVEWQQAKARGGELRRYADAASEISSREWTRRGLEWCASQASHFFHEGGMLRLLRREARERSSEGQLSEQQAQAIRAAAQREKAAPIRLLDVGACESHFASLPGAATTALGKPSPPPTQPLPSLCFAHAPSSHL